MSNDIQLCQVVCIILVILSVKSFVFGKPQVPCFFIFGDSLVDSGNNNNLETFAKVNYWPYGIDFPEGPTGRFTNGQNTIDIIVKRLGFEDYIPPFATANGSEIAKGVNYGSGSAGIRDETGKNQGVCISLSEQLENHKTTVSRIAKLLGSEKEAMKHLNKCLYSFTIGSNDYINNYFLSQFYNTSKLYTPEKYAQVLAKQYSRQIRALYKLGARKMYLNGLGPIGCTPFATSNFGNGSLCVDKFNVAAGLFNKQLRSVVERLSSKYTNANLVFVGLAERVLKYSSPHEAAAALKLTGCCDVGEYGLCIPMKPPCKKRQVSLFWDSFHPTEAVNLLLADLTLTSTDPSELYPMNILQLAQLPNKS